MIKKLYLLTLASVVLLSVSACNGQKPTKKEAPPVSTVSAKKNESVSAKVIVENMLTDIDGDGVPDKIELSIPKEWQDAGEFIAIQIYLGSGQHYQFQDEDGWVSFGPYSTDMPSGNLLKSHRLYLMQASPDERLLVIPGYEYGPGSILTIFKIKKGLVEEVFKKRIRLVSLKDIDNDGRIELIAWQAMQEQIGQYCKEYSAYEVYTLVGKFKYNDELAEKYNRSLTGVYEKDYFNYQENQPKLVLLSLQSGKSELLKMGPHYEKPKQCYGGM